ncbi:hypothetical protein [Streptomyces alanosinicus]|uniref:DUF8094 domain-containing protein n=1 Tax=Streptomyces alanosinicus TaxID=68171 RepID=A0A919D7R6_9ACTN|nr:hypothetical protein [Streptomyces alanosinicus]GHE11423.1 hypothetical protein GCM10010339_71230 [Streptomyces alanosinicus]
MDSAPSAKAKPPVSVDEAQRVLKALDKKDDSDSLSPSYWRSIQEGPWLDRTLARIDSIKARGRDESQNPTNRPHVDPAVRAWVAMPDTAGAGSWILGAQQVSSYAIGGEFKNTVSMRWSLIHRADDGGAWRTAFTADAPSKEDVPQIAVDGNGTAQIVAPNAHLAVQPGKACGAYFDYVTRKSADEHLRWSSQIDTYRATYGQTKPIREQLGNAESVNIQTKAQRAPVGPAWQTKDGGALVACVDVNTVTADMGPGRWLKLTTSGWDGTTGIRWNKFTQTMMQMTILKVPAGSSDISIAAQSTWPYKFDGTEYSEH